MLFLPILSAFYLTNCRRLCPIWVDSLDGRVLAMPGCRCLFARQLSKFCSYGDNRTVGSSLLLSFYKLPLQDTSEVLEIIAGWQHHRDLTNTSNSCRFRSSGYAHVSLPVHPFAILVFPTKRCWINPWLVPT